MEFAKRLTSEPTIYFITGIFLLLMFFLASKDFADKLLLTYGAGIVFFDFLLYSLITPKINMNPIGGNTIQALAWAVGAILILTFIYGLLNSVARVSAVLPPTTGTAYERTFAQISSQAKIFAISGLETLFPLKFLLFALVIPVMETRLIGRIFDFVTQQFNIAYNSLKSPSLWAVIAFIASAFMFFHKNVRGIENNLDNLMTFIFGVISILLIIKFKEMESATEFHIGWNGLALLKGG